MIKSFLLALTLLAVAMVHVGQAEDGKAEAGWLTAEERGKILFSTEADAETHPPVVNLRVYNGLADKQIREMVFTAQSRISDKETIETDFVVNLELRPLDVVEVPGRYYLPFGVKPPTKFILKEVRYKAVAPRIDVQPAG